MYVDKSWIIIPNRRSPEYQQGLNSFIELCKKHVDSRGYVRCACAKCENSLIITFRKMKGHMCAYGICRTYKKWIYHGESLIPPVVAVDDVAPTNDKSCVIEDVMVMDEHKEEDIKLYPGCTKFSSLDFLAKLMHIKVKNKWSNSSFDELLKLLQSSHPKGNKIPPSHYVANKTLKQTPHPLLAQAQIVNRLSQIVSSNKRSKKGDEDDKNKGDD